MVNCLNWGNYSGNITLTNALPPNCLIRARIGASGAYQLWFSQAGFVGEYANIAVSGGVASIEFVSATNIKFTAPSGIALRDIQAYPNLKL